MNATEQIVGNVLKTRFEDIPEDIVGRAKDEIIDTVGCVLVGANDTGCPMLINLIKEWGGSKESTVLAYGLQAPSHNVALANAVMARSFDYGMVDMYVEGVVKSCHIGETVVPAAMAVAEQKALSGKDLLTAVILSEDLTSRILAAQKTRGGWNHTATATTFGATAAAGKLWGLDEKQFLNAFGIALDQVAGSIQDLVDRVHCFKLGQGLAAQRGVFSVRLASKGFTGVKDPFLGENGYFDLYSPDPDAGVLTRNLGEKFWTSVTFKPYPCCRGAHGAIECSLEVAGKNNINPDDIDEVEVIVNTNSTPVSLRNPFEIGEVPHVNAIFSLQYTVANALVRGYPKPEHFTEEAIRDPRVGEMVNKIKMATQDFPNESFLCATVRIKTKDGRKFSEHINVPKGNELEHPMTREEKREKFLRNANFCGKVPLQNAEKAMDMIERLEEIKDFREIAKLLVP